MSNSIAIAILVGIVVITVWSHYASDEESGFWNKTKYGIMKIAVLTGLGSLLYFCFDIFEILFSGNTDTSAMQLHMIVLIVSVIIVYYTDGFKQA